MQYAALPARYGADLDVSESGIEGVTAESLVERMRQFGHRGAEYAASTENGIEMIVEGAEAGDLILTLGAGSVSQAGEKILEKLRVNAGGPGA